LVKHGTRVQRKRTPSLIPHFKEKQSSNNIIIEDWLVERLTEKLREASITVQQRHNPHLLYRATIEENEVAIQEEVGIISGKHIVIMIYSYWGFYCIWFSENRSIHIRQIYKMDNTKREKESPFTMP
jgi:hypothetical protein